jgi:hypothetical protein
VWMITILGGNLSFVGDLGFGGVGNWKYCGGWWYQRICKEPNIAPKLLILDCKYIQPWVHCPSLLSKPYTLKFFCRIQKTSRAMLHGFMQNHARAKNVCKKTRKTRSWQSLTGYLPFKLPSRHFYKGSVHTKQHFIEWVQQRRRANSLAICLILPIKTRPQNLSATVNEPR